MANLLLLSAFLLTFASAIGWLVAYQEISKTYRLRDNRSRFDVNLQSTVLRDLFSSRAVEKLGVAPDQVMFARAILILGLVSQAALVALLVMRY